MKIMKLRVKKLVSCNVRTTPTISLELVKVAEDISLNLISVLIIFKRLLNYKCELDLCTLSQYSTRDVAVTNGEKLYASLL